jgi:hypothetical protein
METRLVLPQLHAHPARLAHPEEPLAVVLIRTGGGPYSLDRRIGREL